MRNTNFDQNKNITFTIKIYFLNIIVKITCANGHFRQANDFCSQRSFREKNCN